MIQSVYRSTLRSDGSSYLKKCLDMYYTIRQMRVSKKGHYELVINNIFGMNIKIYKKDFYPFDIHRNLLFDFNGECTAIGEVKLTIDLCPNEIYYLVMATNLIYVDPSFSVISTGPSVIYFNQSGE